MCFCCAAERTLNTKGAANTRKHFRRMRQETGCICGGFDGIDVLETVIVHD